MRRAALLLPLFLLAACEQDFDDQYAETEKQLRADARQLDKEQAAEAKREPGDIDRKTVR